MAIPVATSVVFPSNANVIAIQFATQQSPPTQRAPDDTFRDPGLPDYDWQNDAKWHVVGDAIVTYDADKFMVLINRNASGQVETLDGGEGVVNRPIHPVLRFDPVDVIGDDGSIGGIESPDITVSPHGTIWGAARFIASTDIDDSMPVTLEIIDPSGPTVLASKDFTAKAGQIVEDYIGLVLQGDDPTDDYPVYRVRLVQHGGPSTDGWQVQALSLFDDTITWEFSNNGGSTWQMAHGIRNNPYGVMRFPSVEDGNQLCYRLIAYSLDCWVNSIQLRPWYDSRLLARREWPQRWGPNVSSFDQNPSVTDDPEFNVWTKPIPRSWFRAARLFPYLPTDIPDPWGGTPFLARFTNDFAITVDVVTTEIHSLRYAEDAAPADDVATVTGTYIRHTADDISGVTDAVAHAPYISPNWAPDDVPGAEGLNSHAEVDAGVIDIYFPAGGMTGALNVLFDGVNAVDYVVISDTHVRALTPIHAADTTVPVQVRLSDGSLTDAAIPTMQMDYLAVNPSIDSIDNGSASDEGGATITCTGRHLYGLTSAAYGVTNIVTDGIHLDTLSESWPSTFLPIDVNTVQFTMPEIDGAPDSGGVRFGLLSFATKRTTVVYLAEQVFVSPRIQIASITPTSGPTTGGTTVDVTFAVGAGSTFSLSSFIIDDLSQFGVSSTGPGIIHVELTLSPHFGGADEFDAGTFDLRAIDEFGRMSPVVSEDEFTFNEVLMPDDAILPGDDLLPEG